MGDRYLSDRYERIRKALAMDPTPGPWGISELSSDLQRDGYRFALSRDGAGRWIAKITHEANGGCGAANAAFIAACDPDTIRSLLAERDELAEQLRLATIAEALAEAEANDAVIAAAPDLLEALRSFEREITSRFGRDADMSADLRAVVLTARAAIARAEGRSDGCPSEMRR